MLTGKATFVKLSLNVEKYKKTLAEALEVQMRQAARVWLRTLLKPGLIPIWTGTSRGVFIPLGSFLRVDTTVTPSVFRTGQGPAYGAAESNFSFVNGRTSSTFEFSHSLDRLTFNDQFNANLYGLRLKNPGPYRAFEQATKAWELYVQEVMPDKLPNPGDFESRSSLIYG